MPSKDKGKRQSSEQGSEARPFMVFYVNRDTPEEVHTDTIMAHDCENALTIAGKRHRADIILYVRGIGDTERSNAQTNAVDTAQPCKNRFPCARFINGEFRQATPSDDQLLESLFE